MAEGESVEVDTTKLRNAAGKVGEIAGRVGDTVDNLKNTLDQKGHPWGNDSYGDKFTEGEQGYDKSSKNLLDGAGNMKKSLDQFNQSMNDAANKMDNMDQF